jgi:Flp pilus assembly protein TadG
LPFLLLLLVLLFEMLLASARRAPVADAAPDAAAAAAAGARVTGGVAVAVARPSVTAGLPLPEQASSSVLYSPSDGPPDDVPVRDPEFLERYE